MVFFYLCNIVMTMYLPCFYHFLIQHFMVPYKLCFISLSLLISLLPQASISVVFSPLSSFFPHFPGWPFKVGQPWIADWPDSNSWIISKSDHDGGIKIYWFFDMFSWWQLESTRGRVLLLWCMALCNGLATHAWAELETSPPTLKKKRHYMHRFSSLLNVMLDPKAS